MDAAATYLTVDLGAESGRALLGRFDGERVDLRELHRFPNEPVRLPDGLHWNPLQLYQNVLVGLTTAREHGGALEGVGIDSWAVDYGLLDRKGSLLSIPYHYRDARTDGMLVRATERVSREEIYSTTGIQFMPINTLYQLLSMEGSPLLDAADTFLMIPDLLAYWLTGRKVCEYTNATSTHLY
ncbi:MAG: FGGY family carbohydrate kinase, partial [Chloroflexota bacterium]|nr:FGGY family carbohydrate kinase [Chloroflexota bacterium]